MRHTNIVATIGPATSSDGAIEALIDAGVDVFRLNFSHGTYDGHAAVIARVRAAAARRHREVAILQDLAGPKIRTGRLHDAVPVRLNEGGQLRIAIGDAPGDAGRIFTTFAPLTKAVRRGDMLLLDDGRIQLEVEAVTDGELRTRVVDGGLLGEHKGISAPGVAFPAGALTTKDRTDLRFGVEQGVDFIALSFVQGAEDLRDARAAVRAAGAPELPLVAKLERPQAIEQLEAILGEADAVMVARGDLGLEMPLEQVPRVQKLVTRRARALGVPVIVATQVLESMLVEPRPTRAEVSDAANAVDDGVDAIMLAGETAVGSHPVRAVQTLDRIIRDAEQMPPVGAVPFEGGRLLRGHGRALCEAAVTLAGRGDAAAIVAVTRGGKTARLLSALRPHAPIYAATDDIAIARRLALAWGVVPVIADLGGEVSAAGRRIGEQLVAHGAIAAGSVVVLVSITPDLAAGPSNFLRIQRV